MSMAEKERKNLRRLWRRLSAVPHLFAKTVIVYCVGFVSLCCLWSLRIASRTGILVEGLLLAVMGFFGGELLLLCLKTIFGGRKKEGES